MRCADAKIDHLFPQALKCLVGRHHAAVCIIASCRLGLVEQPAGEYPSATDVGELHANRELRGSAASRNPAAGE